MKKLPNIYKNPAIKKVKNNKEVFDSLKEENTSIVNSNDLKMPLKDDSYYDNLSVYEKIKELINQNSYIFNTKVSLLIDDKEKICQIAGVVNNHIITMDNEIIKIETIKDIKILK